MMEREIFGPRGAPFSHAIGASAKRLVFISGQLGTEGERAIDGDLEAQARVCFRRIEALLREAGGELRDIVKMTTFVTTFEGYAQYGALRRELFGELLPANTTVRVAGLLTPGCVIEIEAIAALEGDP